MIRPLDISDAKWEDLDFLDLDDDLDLGDIHETVALSGDLLDTVALLGNYVLQGRKGSAFTAAMVAGGMAYDPATLTAFYKANQSVIEGYFNHVDLKRLAEQTGATDSISTTLKHLGIGFLIGAGVGALAIKLTS